MISKQTIYEEGVEIKYTRLGLFRTYCLGSFRRMKWGEIYAFLLYFLIQEDTRLTMFTLDNFIGLMLYKLKRIGNNESILFHVVEYSVFNLSHLFGKKIHIDIIISVNISHQKIFFQNFQIRISEKYIQEFSINIRDMLDFVSITLDAERSSEKSHRFAVTTSQIYKFFSTNKFQMLFHKFNMPIKRRYIHRQGILTKKRRK